MLVIALAAYTNAQDNRFDNPTMGFGFTAGGAQGDNSGKDIWVMQYRGFLEYKIISHYLLGQAGVGYLTLQAPGVYGAGTAILDNRFLFVPFSMEQLNPFLYAGIGVSKQIDKNGSDYLGMIPFGVGVQTRLGSQLLLDVSGGYNLSSSDKLDGGQFPRSNSNLNSFTDGKNDGFFGFQVGLVYTIGGRDRAAEEAKRIKAEEDAMHARELAMAEARRVQDSTNAAKEAAHLKDAYAAEARRIQDSTNAAAEALRLKGSNITEAQRIKDSTNAALAEALRIKDSVNAAALRLAEQNSRDTLIVLIKGKTVILKGVNFEFNKATLTKYSERILWRAYNAMVANPNVRVVITGHTDNVGSEKYNQTLSLHRAQSVKNWLVSKGIESNRMRTVGRGKLEPIASNDTEQGRLENRRIEFYVEQ
jgi:outer membrane protein OmpA-like peptidoglycan-associated protein